jgi:hypothetical protein
MTHTHTHIHTHTHTHTHIVAGGANADGNASGDLMSYVTSSYVICHIILCHMSHQAVLMQTEMPLEIRGHLKHDDNSPHPQPSYGGRALYADQVW